MNFSLLCPARERPESLKRLLESLNEMTADKQNTEILLAMDDDDIVDQSFLAQNAYRYTSLNTQILKRPRSEFLNRDYYNWLAPSSSGRYLWAIGDDVQFLIKGWDLAILRRIESYLQDKPDRIFCASIKDTTPKPKELPIPFPCFPLISREAYQILGFVLHPEIPTWGADYALYELYNGAGRILNIHDQVYLDHISHHTGQVLQDALNKRIELIAKKYNVDSTHNAQCLVRHTIPRQIELLKNKINQGALK